jgi:primary-amine oxidase
VTCSTFSIGWFGEATSKRLLKLLCFYIEGTVTLYVRPLEGITLVVDLDEMKIVEYFDRFIVPVPNAEGTEYRASKQKPLFGPRLNGAAFVQPNGAGFKIDGHTVRLVNPFYVSFEQIKQLHPMPTTFDAALIGLSVSLSLYRFHKSPLPNGSPCQQM